MGPINEGYDSPESKNTSTEIDSADIVELSEAILRLTSITGKLVDLSAKLNQQIGNLESAQATTTKCLVSADRRIEHLERLVY